ncbi:MAG: hypothetical protein HXS54_08240 [Theionarchaea archaeon]|nr:hypothetical protein [Theionarchaea archaeon]
MFAKLITPGNKMLADPTACYYGTTPTGECGGGGTPRTGVCLPGPLVVSDPLSD